MRMTNWKRSVIVSQATAAAFDQAKTDLKKREAELCLEIRNAFMTPQQIAAVDSLPANFFASGSITVTSGVEGDSLYTHISSYGTVRIPMNLSNYTQVIGGGEHDDLLVKVKEFNAAEQDYLRERRDFERQTQGVVYAFNDSKKLLAQWPTLKDIMSEGFFDETKAPTNLPVATINALDELLQSKRPFPAELKAAA